MSAILLDVDGVFHVSGQPIDGGGEAVARLARRGHRLRFVTNNTTHSRRRARGRSAAFGVELDDAELQTTPLAAAHALAGEARAGADDAATSSRTSTGSSSSARAPTPCCSAARTKTSDERTRSSAT